MDFGQYFLPRELILQIFHHFMVKYLRISKDCNKFFSDNQFWIETYKKEKITVGYSLEGDHTNLMVHYFKIKNNSKLFWNKPLYKFNFTGDPFDYSGKINRKFYNTYQNYVLSFMEKNKRLITTFACHNPYHRKFVHHLCDIVNLGHLKILICTNGHNITTLKQKVTQTIGLLIYKKSIEKGLDKILQNGKYKHIKLFK
jgi:hypothetical protein